MHNLGGADAVVLQSNCMLRNLKERFSLRSQLPTLKARKFKRALANKADLRKG